MDELKEHSEELPLKRGEMAKIFSATGLSIKDFFIAAKELYSESWYYKRLNNTNVPLALAGFFEDYVTAHIGADTYENLLRTIREKKK